ncbi:FAD-binding oxidoreductase [Kineosporia rhizophila]|uniref:NAD(P)/FAD-dependent oxidoreductase n=1 Tax=Kineosporia rhizophila TaxID=84633 RepID=UPI001E3F51C8|nr:FAD-binding oxidoreductase [Kineosporia rhizophila]MCE0536300.1 FAD-binding oxidoreductase [Kineosporia rhizophila]
MPEASGVLTAGAVVVGGGINGAALAYYLASSGVENVVLLEATELGSGATAGSMGNVRQQYGTALEIECSRRGLAFWKSLGSSFGLTVPFHEDGYLMLTSNEASAETLRKHAAVQIEQGMPDVHLLTPDQIPDVAPYLDTTGLVLGSYTPLDGHVMPTDGVTALVAAARSLGVVVKRHWPVEAVVREGSSWRVQGPQGEVVAPNVALVAGIGTKKLVEPFGVQLDMYEGRHLGLITENYLPGRKLPTTVDIDTGMVIEREGDQLMVAMLSRNPAPRDYDHLAELFYEAASVRAPQLTDLSMVSRYTAWPVLGGDGHPYVGLVEEGLWALTFTGHGAMHGPPVAQALAREMIGDPDGTLDLSEWDIRREPAEQSVLWRRQGKE